MAGIGSYLLLMHLCDHPAAAFCASLIFVFAPYHIATLKGIMQLISLEWLPFYILFLLRATSYPLPDSIPPRTLSPDLITGWWQKRWKDIGGASLFLVLTALTDWYYTIFLIGYTLVYMLWQVVTTIIVAYPVRAFTTLACSSISQNKGNASKAKRRFLLSAPGQLLIRVNQHHSFARSTLTYQITGRKPARLLLLIL